MLKKLPVFAIIVFLASVIFSCTLPSAVEVKAKPNMSVPAKAEFGSYLTDGIKDNFKSDDTTIKVYDCEKVPVQTFLIHLPQLIRFDLTALIEGILPANISFDTLDNLPANTPPITIPPANPGQTSMEGTTAEIDLSELDGFLNGFQFFAPTAKDPIGLEGKLILKCSPNATGFGDLLQIELFDHARSSPGFSDNSITFSQEVVDLKLKENGDETVSELEKLSDINTGKNINDVVAGILNKREPLTFDYTFSLKAGKQITLQMLKNIKNGANIDAELLVWLPLKLTAPNGADLKFPKMFEEGEDIFGRKSGSKDDSMIDMVRSASVTIELNAPVFQGATLNLHKNLPPIPIENENLVLNITSDDMEVINTVPFCPDMSISFKKPDDPTKVALQVPRNLSATKLRFEADINYRIKL